MRRLILAAAVAVWGVAGASLAQDAPDRAPLDSSVSAQQQPAEQAQQAQAPTAEEQAQAQAFFDSLNRRTGAISLLDGKLTLTVPESHYFIGPEDARRVLVEVWRNPPAAAEGVLGMVFLADANPMFSWGAVVEYKQDGHVADTDASTINYDNLMRDMQREVVSANPERVRQGYPELTLEGWAEQPHYEQATHTLYWAKLLAAKDGGRSLNYDVRVLGREGVFVISFVAAPEELELIRASAPAVMAMPAFSAGNRYADYREGVDPAAAYGIGGLIAGGALAAAAQKTGLLALLLAFGKKFVVLIAAAGAAVVSFFRRLFGRRPKD